MLLLTKIDNVSLVGVDHYRHLVNDREARMSTPAECGRVCQTKSTSE